MQITASNHSNRFLDYSFTERLGSNLSKLSIVLSLPYYESSEQVIRSFITPLTPKTYGNSVNKITEILRRVFAVTTTVTLSPISLGLYICAQIINLIVNKLLKVPYLHLEGNALAKENKTKLSILSLNACMFWGGLPRLFGGLSPSKERIDKLCRLIIEKDADIIIMQEILYDAALKIHNKLKDHYSHFFTRISPNICGLESGLFFASKQQIKRQPIFVPFPQQRGIKKGVLCVETSRYWVLATHLEAGTDRPSQEKRKKQMDIIKNQINALKAINDKPCILAGDFNAIRQHENTADEYTTLRLSEDFFDPYANQYPTVNTNSTTCTEQLNSYMRGNPLKEEVGEIIDYILVDNSLKNNQLFNTEKVAIFSLSNPADALSDHHALLMSIQPIQF